MTCPQHSIRGGPCNLPWSPGLQKTFQVLCGQTTGSPLHFSIPVGRAVDGSLLLQVLGCKRHTKPTSVGAPCSRWLCEEQSRGLLAMKEECALLSAGCLLCSSGEPAGNAAEALHLVAMGEK